MERHIRILAILSSVWGGLAITLGISLLLLAAGGLALLAAPESASVGFAAGLASGLFAVTGLCALLWGGAHVWSAALVRRHRPLGRVLTIGLAVVDVLALPFGTALGIYALWVLLRNDGRHVFEAALH